jgi:hypothetical protein
MPTMPPLDGLDSREHLATAYSAVWNALNQPQPGPVTDLEIPDGTSFDNVFDHFRTRGLARNLNLQSLSEEEERYLTSIGIISRHVKRNLAGATDESRFVDPLRFQIHALEQRRLRAICPFTGSVTEARHTLLANIHVIFYRFVAQEVFYLVTANIGTGYRKHAFYFPKHDLLIRSGDPWGCDPDDVNELKARVVCHASDCCAYLQEDTRDSAVCLGYYHFAHHLWNELSGLQRLHDEKLLERVGALLVLYEPLGPIDEIYPEIGPSRISRLADTDHLFTSILRNKYFAVRVGGYFIKQEVSDRAFRVSRLRSSAATLETALKARSEYWPLLWIGIRVDSRTWSDPVDGLAHLLVSLSEQYPRLGVVFDGFSVPADHGRDSGKSPAISASLSSLIERERGIVTAVLERVERLSDRQIRTFNIIGSSIHEASVWADAIDVYVSPFGTLQHKVGWLRCKPGVVHCNRKLLQQPPPRLVWAASENGIKPRYVSVAAVRDIPETEKRPVVYRQMMNTKEIGAGIRAGVTRVQGDPDFQNYEVDWKMLYQDVLHVLHGYLGVRQRLPTYYNRIRVTLTALARRATALVKRDGFD